MSKRRLTIKTLFIINLYMITTDSEQLLVMPQIHSFHQQEAGIIYIWI